MHRLELDLAICYLFARLRLLLDIFWWQGSAIFDSWKVLLGFCFLACGKSSHAYSLSLLTDANMDNLTRANFFVFNVHHSVWAAFLHIIQVTILRMASKI